MAMVPGPPPRRLTIEEKRSDARDNAEVVAAFILRLNSELAGKIRSDEDRIKIICAALKK